MNCICCKNWGKCICHREGNMAEIYCSDIDSDGNVDEGGKPPFVPTCGDEEPAFITPAQYKERTGRDFEGAVWVVSQGSLADTGDYSLGLNLMTYEDYRAGCEYAPKKFAGMPSPLCVLGAGLPNPETDFEEDEE
ncbi:MAG: hypothetical protein MdMp014T_1888 [Treponematales bacterium]